VKADFETCSSEKDIDTVVQSRIWAICRKKVPRLSLPIGWKSREKDPRRRFQAHLYGRNNRNAGSTAASVLDEDWATETYSSDQTRRKAEATHFWRLQLAGR
jgi:hypothetical protein